MAPETTSNNQPELHAHMPAKEGAGSLDALVPDLAGIEGTPEQKAPGGTLGAVALELVTRRIGLAAQQLINDAHREPLGGTGLYAASRSEDFRSGESGVVLSRFESQDTDGKVIAFGSLAITAHDGDRRPHVIPTIPETGEVDDSELRKLGRNERLLINSMMDRLITQNPPTAQPQA
ncbi:hypothetical protein CR970_00610 [Candidatus Saccharibacteria bacterium]|nr:MAG: hypothetical protein CR970_00610 [Candidatus Saccharibacteria bacterium]